MPKVGDRDASSVEAYIEKVDAELPETFRPLVDKMRAIVPKRYDEAMT